jgi:hypothetical protein
MSFNLVTAEAAQHCSMRASYIIQSVSSEDPEYPAKDVNLDFSKLKNYTSTLGLNDEEVQEEY